MYSDDEKRVAINDWMNTPGRRIAHMLSETMAQRDQYRSELVEVTLKNDELQEQIELAIAQGEASEAPFYQMMRILKGELP